MKMKRALFWTIFGTACILARYAMLNAWQETTIIDDWRFMPIIDCHVHPFPALGFVSEQELAENPGETRESLAGRYRAKFADDLYRAGRQLGVARVAIGLHATHMGDRANGAPRFSMEFNQWVLDAKERHPDFFVPLLGGFDPEDPKAPELVKSELETGKYAGVGELDLKCNPKQVWVALDSPILMKVWAVIEEYGKKLGRPVVVFIHAETRRDGVGDDESATGEWERICTAFKGVQFVKSHSACEDWATRFRNAWGEIPYDPEDIEWRFTERTVLGSDVQNPDLHVNFFDKTASWGEAVLGWRKLKLAKLRPGIAQKIAYRNACNLLGLDADEIARETLARMSFAKAR